MIGRVTGTYVQAVNDPLFYVHNLLYQLFPWSILFFIAVFFEFRALIKNRFKSHEYFTLTGVWIYFIVINSASSQLPNYVFAIVPLMAVIASKWIVNSTEKLTDQFNIFLYVQTAMVILAWLGIVFVSIYLFPSPKVWFWIIPVTGIASTVYIYATTQKGLIKLTVPSVIAAFSIMFLMNTHVFPYVFSYQSTGKAARYVNEMAGEGDKLFDYKHAQHELFFYSEIETKQLYEPEEIKPVAGIKGHWIFTNADGYSDLLRLPAEPDTVIEYRHLDLSRPAKFLNPLTREKALKAMYLVKY